MSEGFFDFSNKLLTRFATNTSDSRHPLKGNTRERLRDILRNQAPTGDLLGGSTVSAVKSDIDRD